MKAAKAFESAGAVVTEVDGILTREMLDGPRQFLARADVGRALQAFSGGTRQGAALYLPMGGTRRKALGRRGHQRFQRDDGDPRRRGKAVLRSRLRDLAGIAGGEFPRRIRRADQRSRKAVRAHLLHRAVEHVGESRRFDQWRLRQTTAFRSACRSSAAASTTSACSAWPRRSRACGVRRSRGRHRRRSNDLFDAVRAGLVPAIHVLRSAARMTNRRGSLGTSPGMTIF